jgi:hypothetical protein
MSLGRTREIDGKQFTFLVSAAWDHQICLWDTKNCSLLQSIHLLTNTSDTTGKEDQNGDGKDDECMSVENGGIEDNKEDEVKDAANEENNENGERDNNEDRSYDESRAGNFPLLITLCDQWVPLSNGLGTETTLLAVIFRHIPAISLFAIETSNADSSSAQFGNDSKPVCVINLPASPVDVCFKSSTMQLVVLLPSPWYLQSYSLTQNTDNSFSYTQEEVTACNAFNTYASSQGTLITYCNILIICSSLIVTIDMCIRTYML